MKSKKDTKIIASVVHHYPKVISTNDLAAQFLSEKNPAEGTVISADYQSGGKGQYGRIWHGEAYKNIYLSIILYPKFLDIEQVFLLHIWSAVSIRALIEEVTGLQALIKWPNDLLIHSKKIAGILIANVIRQKQIDSSIIGIGLNVLQENFPSFDKPATSLRLETDQTLLLPNLRMRLLEILDSNYMYLQKDPEYLLHDFNSYLDLKERYHSNTHRNLKLISLDIHGIMTVRSEDKILRISASTLHQNTIRN